MANEQKKKIKKYLTIVTTIIILFGSDTDKTTCGNIQIKTWEIVMVFLLINHFIGRPKDLTGMLVLIFGFWMINGLTFIWSLKGLFNIIDINTNTPGCLDNSEKMTIILEIILGFLFTAPLCLMVFSLSVSCVCFPVYCVVYLLCGKRLRRSRLFRNIDSFFANRAPGQNDENGNLGENVNNRNRFNEDQIVLLKEKCEYVYIGDEVEKGNDDKDCSICLDIYKNGDSVIQFKLCPHKFHSICLENWLKVNKVCPLCRKNTKLEIGVEDEQEEAEIEQNGPENPNAVQLGGARPLELRELGDNNFVRDLIIARHFSTRNVGGMDQFMGEDQIRMMIWREMMAREIFRRLQQEQRMITRGEIARDRIFRQEFN